MRYMLAVLYKVLLAYIKYYREVHYYSLVNLKILAITP